MDMHTEKQSYSLIDSMDLGLRDNILRLDRKLKGLRAEIAAKLESPFLAEEEIRDEYVQKLSVVADEVDAAIFGIETLVNLVSSQDQEMTNAFMQSEEMRKFSEMISTNLEKITEISAKF